MTFEFEAAGVAEFTCELDGVGGPCSSPWRRTDLPAGPHRFSVSAGGEPAVREWQVDRAAPAVAWRGPATAFSLTGSVLAAWVPLDEETGVASSDVRVRTGSWDGGLGEWRHPAAWQGTSGSGVTEALPAGTTACLSVRARDRAGNVSAWSPERCTTAPLDDRALARSGAWNLRSGRAFYRETVSTAGSDGARLTLRDVRTGRLALVTSRCRSCGTITVYVNGVRVARVNLKARRATPRVVVELRSYRGLWRGTVVVVASRGAYVDGLGAAAA